MTLKRSASSLKLLISANGKLCTTCCPGDLPDPNEMGSVCANCSVVQPLKVRLVLSGFQDANSTTCTRGQSHASKYTGGTADILNGSHLLPWDNLCFYKKDISANLVYSGWDDLDCSDPEAGGSPFTCVGLRLWANDIGSGVSIGVMYLTPQEVIFSGTIPYTGGDVCFNTDNTINNTYIGGPCTLQGMSAVDPATGTIGIQI